MMACTSPAFTVRVMPFRISRSPTLACRSFISSNAIRLLALSWLTWLTHASFETHAEQFLRFHGELHGELAENFLAESMHDHGHGIFARDAALAAVEDLVFADFRGGGFVFYLRRGVAHLQIG